MTRSTGLSRAPLLVAAVLWASLALLPVRAAPAPAAAPARMATGVSCDTLGIGCAPVGFGIEVAHPDRVQAIMVRDVNAYDVRLDNPFLAPMKANWADSPPDTWTLDQATKDRPGIKDILLELRYSDRSNHDRHAHWQAQWQAHFRKYPPPLLIVCGRNDTSCPVIAAASRLRDLPEAELHLVDTGHFALEEDCPDIASLMRDFLARHIKPD
jgi:pimeloyl-ACP methyl ester carboxylesterase